jgi:hypothetical protein
MKVPSTTVSGEVGQPSAPAATADAKADDDSPDIAHLEHVPRRYYGRFVARRSFSPSSSSSPTPSRVGRSNGASSASF